MKGDYFINSTSLLLLSDDKMAFGKKMLIKISTIIINADYKKKHRKSKIEGKYDEAPGQKIYTIDLPIG